MSQVATTNNSSLFARTAERYGVKPGDLSRILRATAFRGSVNDEQMAALLIVAEQFKLNPFTKEIYAFPDSKAGGIVPVIGVDGWNRIVNEHPQMDGFEFRQSEETTSCNGHKCPEWIECLIYRKDRNHPVVVREYIDECSRNVGPWQSHPKRMLRHKSFIQAARMAFGFSGIYDDDEAERIAEARVIEAQETMAAPIDVTDTAAPLELPPAARFEALLEDMGVTVDKRPLVEEYVAVCCKHFNCGRDQALEKFLDKPDDFRRIYPDWEKNVLAKRQQAVEEKPKRKPVKKQAVEAEIVQGEAQTEPAESVETPAPQSDYGDILCPYENSDGSQRIVEIADCEKCSERVGCPAHDKK